MADKVDKFSIVKAFKNRIAGVYPGRPCYMFGPIPMDIDNAFHLDIEIFPKKENLVVVEFFLDFTHRRKKEDIRDLFHDFEEVESNLIGNSYDIIDGVNVYRVLECSANTGRNTLPGGNEVYLYENRKYLVKLVRIEPSS